MAAIDHVNVDLTIWPFTEHKDSRADSGLTEGAYQALIEWVRSCPIGDCEPDTIKGVEDDGAE